MENGKALVIVIGLSNDFDNKYNVKVINPSWLTKYLEGATCFHKRRGFWKKVYKMRWL
jgi:hypothetical protein